MTDLASSISVVAGGASVVAAAAPTLCAVHCVAMPFVAMLLPGLSATGKFCMHKVGRRIAYYFVLPVGLVGNAAGYTQHKNEALVASSLSGMSCILYGAATAHSATVRNLLNATGCVLMLGSSYRAHQIAEEQGTGCCHGCDHTE
mmetsp:Transcript_110623/g.219940  ORF Transcript_110623/g.219940 Transcript_110623/m.219940 type:complete len:145 (+) Transcript_110623:56-490(+)|eukprot:CAMPEP_0172824636 /NCGR_PEP_ID=MMETSP1075-20121228/18137_1 /TAXON_ID=2916 /ORGANISM="Ceratium fusus, Strain PA161109" /LENGTH=144 /DNA_ID=CAMNT_0013665947 /DNA_START=50 /DNA_END=484 /DNA_ORIENTATION=-